MNMRRMASFVVLLPAGPLALIAVAFDDEATIASVVECFKNTWRRIYEKR